MARKVADIMQRDVVQHLEEKLCKAFATKVSDMMTADVETISPRVDCLAALSGDE